jgi:hypothetical protein
MRRIAAILVLIVVVTATAACTRGSSHSTAPDAPTAAGSTAGTDETGTVFYSPPRFPDPPSAGGKYLSRAQAQARVPFAIRPLNDPPGGPLTDFVLVDAGPGRPGVEMRNANLIQAQYHAETTAAAAAIVPKAPPVPFDARYMREIRVAGDKAFAWDAVDTGRGTNDVVVPSSGIVFHLGRDWFVVESPDGKVSAEQLVRMAQGLEAR